MSAYCPFCEYAFEGTHCPLCDAIGVSIPREYGAVPTTSVPKHIEYLRDHSREDSRTKFVPRETPNPALSGTLPDQIPNTNSLNGKVVEQDSDPGSQDRRYIAPPELADQIAGIWWEDKLNVVVQVDLAKKRYFSWHPARTKVRCLSIGSVEKTSTGVRLACSQTTSSNNVLIIDAIILSSGKVAMLADRLVLYFWRLGHRQVNRMCPRCNAVVIVDVWHCSSCDYKFESIQDVDYPAAIMAQFNQLKSASC